MILNEIFVDMLNMYFVHKLVLQLVFLVEHHMELFHSKKIYTYIFSMKGNYLLLKMHQ